MENERAHLRRLVFMSWILYFLGAVTVVGMLFTSIFSLYWRPQSYDTRYESHFIVQLWTAPLVVIVGLAVFIVPIATFQLSVGGVLLAVVAWLTVTGLSRVRADREFPRLRRMILPWTQPSSGWHSR